MRATVFFPVEIYFREPGAFFSGQKLVQTSLIVLVDFPHIVFCKTKYWNEGKNVSCNEPLQDLVPNEEDLLAN